MDDETPSAKALSTAGGYSQVYVIHATEKDAKEADPDDTREVLFRCGNWAYRGKIQFNGLKISSADLPLLIPVLQKQQGSLRYFCNASTVPESSDYFMPLQFLSDAVDFFATEMIQDSLQDELREMARTFPWVDDDGSSTFFEMELDNVPHYMDVVSLIASKTYTRGLIIISVFADNRMYFVVQSGEGDQALLDVRFPDISKHGEGMQLATYHDHSISFRKLTLWHAVQKQIPILAQKELPKIKTLNVSSKSYTQTYCIMRSSWDQNSPQLSVFHDVLFRFGSWCYSGRVQLTSTLALADIPLIIPALRMQQSRLDFLCDTSNVPITSPFAGALNFANRTAPLVEQHVEQCELLLQNIIEQTRRDSPQEAEAIERWLDGDPSETFFEMSCTLDSAQRTDLSNIELIASKTYHASGVVTVAIYFESNVYVIVQDAGKENPLLDSRFPDVSNKGRGFQIQSFGDDGAENWPALRKLSIWQNKNATNRDHIAQLAKEESDAKDAAPSVDSKGVARNLEDAHFRQDALNDRFDAKDYLEDSMDVHADVSTAARADAKGSPGEDIERKPIRSVNTNSAISSESGEPSPTSVVRHANFQVDASVDSIGAKETIGNVGDRIDASAYVRRDADQEGAAALQDSPTSATGRPMFSSPLADSKSSTSGASDSVDFSKSSSTLKAARPHHLPKLASLNDGMSKRMDEIRKGLTEEDSAAPWDAAGRPVEKKKKKNKKTDSKDSCAKEED